MKASLLALAAALTLTACGSDADAPADAAGAEGAAAAAAPAAATGEACLHGTWAADAEHTFRPETFQRLMQGGEGGPDIRLVGTSGRALVTFATDGAMTQRFEDFALSLESAAQGMPLKMTMNMTGANAARYTTEGDRLTFQSDGGAGGNTVRATTTVEVGGHTLPPQEMDSGFFEAHEGDSGGTVVTYECHGDELLLDIASDEEAGQVFFNDARYTRAG